QFMIFFSSKIFSVFSLITIFVCTFISNEIKGQDIHFSQYFNSPLLTNPALTGAVKSNFRLVTNYKEQWRSIATPYKTFAFSYDMGGFIKRADNGFLATGISFISDKAGKSQLGLNQINLSFAYHLRISYKSIVSAAIQGGFAQRSLSYDKLEWGNQFNGSGFDPNLPSFEPTNSKGCSYADFAAGLLWTYGEGEMFAPSNKSLNFNLGVSAFHVNKPVQSIYTRYKKRLPMKFVVHGSSIFDIKDERIFLIPSFTFMLQDNFKYIMGGAMLRYSLIEKSRFTDFVKGAQLYLGCYYRYLDAVVPTIQFEIAQYGIGISYDINTSNLTKVTYGKGGLEFSLHYIPVQKKIIAIKTPRLFN
ncbi:MAG: PorP/SprF family type IX secretion system membrane protein, partial [Bacteroidetes bacterium]|nr:PorP/SprF family type IX secretion system membrane protein [Bacteroidota bacterium]